MTIQDVAVSALIDSGATASFIHRRVVNRLRLKEYSLPQHIALCNVDGTFNKAGVATKYTWQNARIAGQKIPIKLIISDIGAHDVILGHSWLQHHNPCID